MSESQEPVDISTKTMEVVSTDATLTFILPADPQPRAVIPTIETFQRADKLHKLCQGSACAMSSSLTS